MTPSDNLSCRINNLGKLHIDCQDPLYFRNNLKDSFITTISDENSIYLNAFIKFIKELKQILEISKQYQLSECVGLNIKYVKSDIKRGKSRGISRISFNKIYHNGKKKIKEIFSSDPRLLQIKLNRLKQVIQDYFNYLGYEKTPSNLLKLDQLVRDLKRILGVNSLPELARYMNLKDRFFVDLRSDIKKGKTDFIAISTLYISRAYIRINLIFDEKFADKKKKLEEIDQTIFHYFFNNLNRKESVLYARLMRLRCFLFSLSRFIGIIKEDDLLSDFDIFFGYDMTNTLYYLKNLEEYRFISEEKFLTALYKFELQYSVLINSERLAKELKLEIMNFRIALKKFGKPIIRKNFINVVRGRFLKTFLNALFSNLDSTVHIPRTLLSKLLFNDRAKLMGVFQRLSDNPFFVSNITADEMLKNIGKLKYTEKSIGILFYEPSFSETDLEQFKLAATAIIKHFSEIGRKININEEIVGFLLRNIFRDCNVIYYHNYRPNWLVSENGHQRDLDWFLEFSNDQCVAIEVNGPFHQKNDQKERDNWKEIKCIEKKIPLVAIDLYKINENSQWKLKELVSFICNNSLIRKISKKMGIPNEHIDDICEYYNQKENFKKLIEKIHSFALRKFQRHRGFMSIGDFI